MGGGRLGRINERICIIMNSLREDGACDDNTVEYFRCAKSNMCDKTYEPECASIGRSVIWYVVGAIGNYCRCESLGAAIQVYILLHQYEYGGIPKGTAQEYATVCYGGKQMSSPNGR